MYGNFFLVPTVCKRDLLFCLRVETDVYSNKLALKVLVIIYALAQEWFETCFRSTVYSNKLALKVLVIIYALAQELFKTCFRSTVCCSRFEICICMFCFEFIHTFKLTK